MAQVQCTTCMLFFSIGFLGVLLGRTLETEGRRSDYKQAHNIKRDLKRDLLTAFGFTSYPTAASSLQIEEAN